MGLVEKLIEKSKQFLRSYLINSEVDISLVNYRYEHSLRVANIGSNLADKEEADKKIVVLACILHDVGKFNVEENKDHGRKSADIARPFLNSLDLCKREVNDICYAIAYHVDGITQYDYVHTLEASIVTDADNIDRYGINAAYRYIQELETYEYQKRIELLNRHIKRLNSFKRLCIATTPDGKIIRPLETKNGCEWFKEQINLQISIFNKLIEEYKII